jgi:hypothetical protein
MWTVILFVVAETSGWRRLAETYAADPEFEGPIWKFEHGQIGWAAFRGNLTVGANKQGLFLRVQFPFHWFCKPLFIPWTVIRTAPKRMWMVDGLAFQLGNDRPVELWVRAVLAEKIRQASL